MTDDGHARSPLADRLGDLARVVSLTDSAVALEHRPFLAQVDLRVDPSRAGRAPFPLPREPNTAWDEGPRAALWLGPDEWLLLGPALTGAQILDSVEASLAGIHHSVVDVSASRVALELRGPGVRELLSKGCSIDLHPRVWPAGSCAQTMLAKAPVILHQREQMTRVLVRSSYTDYLIDWFLASAAG